MFDLAYTLAPGEEFLAMMFGLLVFAVGVVAGRMR